MAYGERRSSSIMDSFTVSPLPYPVLLILAVASIFLLTSWYLSFEEVAESVEEQMNIALLLIPLFLIVLVRWLSSMENSSDMFMSMFSNRRRGGYVNSYGRGGDDGGSSPWGVAALIVLLLVLLQYQSSFLEMWFG